MPYKPQQTVKIMNDNPVSETDLIDENDDLLDLGEFEVEEILSSSSLFQKREAESAAENIVEILPLKFDEIEEPAESEQEQSAAFKTLANPILPERKFDDRAYLQIQSPTRLFFYWSIQNNSFEILRLALGNLAENYGLAIRLVNLTAGTEELMPADINGSAWFNVQPNSEYRAEIGFHNFNRPFIRLIFSNTVQTPRSAPSPNTDYQPYFAVSAAQFAEVLDSAGYSQDAFDVYLTGDSPQYADEATRLAFMKISDGEDADFEQINLAELRSVLFMLASGVSLTDLKNSISSKLFELLQSVSPADSKSSEEKIIEALEEFFGFSPFFEETEEFVLPTVFGASAINFPKDLRRRIRFLPDKLRNLGNPLQSLSSASFLRSMQ